MRIMREKKRMIDIEGLRKTAEEARRLLSDREKEQARLATEYAREMEHRLAYDYIIRIPEVAKKRAEKGQNSAIVMSFQSLGKPEKLSVSGQLVFDYCKKEGLKPTVEIIEEKSREVWPDKCAIVIHW